MRGCVQVHVGGEHEKVVEVVRGTRIVPICVPELAKVIQHGYFLEGELQKLGSRSARQIGRVGLTHIVVVPKKGKILVLVLFAEPVRFLVSRLCRVRVSAFIRTVVSVKFHIVLPANIQWPLLPTAAVY